MEAHPVPQDILDTEFKLFGGFTLKQFLKLLFACIAALFVFLLNIPFIIKAPIMFMFVIVGIGLATMPRFGDWLTNYLKAIFISPRYVWVKEDRAPEILQGKPKKTSKKTSSVSSTKSRNKIDLSEISLDKLLATRDNPRKSTPIESETEEETVRDQNFNRVFDQLYRDTKQTRRQPQYAAAKKSQAQSPAQQTKAQTSGTALIQQARAQNNQPITDDPDPLEQQQERVPVETLQQQIQQLKQQLHSIVQDEHAKKKEADIMHKINDLMQEIRMRQSDTAMHQASTQKLQKSTKTATPSALPKKQESPKPPAQKITNFQGAPANPGQTVSGVVVDKSGKPISQAEILFDDVGDTQDVLAVTNNRGAFVSKKPLQPGTYNITIKHPEHAFHTYAIQVGGERLPAYKLRAR